jgi:hypothetical protein
MLMRTLAGDHASVSGAMFQAMFRAMFRALARRCSMTEWYFVWVEGLRGPMPQKWSSDGLWGQVGRSDVIVRFPLDDAEAALSLDELARRHPIPGSR